MKLLNAVLLCFFMIIIDSAIGADQWGNNQRPPHQAPFQEQNNQQHVRPGNNQNGQNNLYQNGFLEQAVGHPAVQPAEMPVGQQMGQPVRMPAGHVIGHPVGRVGRGGIRPRPQANPIRPFPPQNQQNGHQGNGYKK